MKSDDTNYHVKDFSELGLVVRWLDGKRAKNAYEFALRFSSKQRYGLSEETVSSIERHEIESDSVADHWLRERLPATGTVQLVFGPAWVCIIDTVNLLHNWQEMFCPGRDDVIILHNLSRTVGFYCHEDELEVSQRIA